MFARWDVSPLAAKQGDEKPSPAEAKKAKEEKELVGLSPAQATKVKAEHSAETPKKKPDDVAIKSVKQAQIKLNDDVKKKVCDDIIGADKQKLQMAQLLAGDSKNRVDTYA